MMLRRRVWARNRRRFDLLMQAGGVHSCLSVFITSREMELLMREKGWMEIGPGLWATPDIPAGLAAHVNVCFEATSAAGQALQLR